MSKVAERHSRLSSPEHVHEAKMQPDNVRYKWTPKQFLQKPEYIVNACN
ncbi:MAG: hypothetical protein ACUZ8H_06695 [Candidatus Anammoxibacter sp.]